MVKGYNEYYESEVSSKIRETVGDINVMAMPKVVAIVVHMRLGRVSKDKHIVKDAINALGDLTGQLPIATKAKKSISNFKTREGQVIGAKVTLRRKRMFDFLCLLRDIVLPRIRDFRGLSKKGDGRGNYNFGIPAHDIFPGIDVNKVNTVFSVDITVVVKNSESDAVTLELLKAHGLPFVA